MKVMMSSFQGNQDFITYSLCIICGGSGVCGLIVATFKLLLFVLNKKRIFNIFLPHIKTIDSSTLTCEINKGNE